MPKLALWRQKLNVFISLRQRMAHFIDNIAYYLQVDVLETHYTQLMKRVSQAEDFQGGFLTIPFPAPCLRRAVIKGA